MTSSNNALRTPRDDESKLQLTLLWNVSFRRLEAELEKEREREELRLADREAERAAKRVKAAQEADAAKQLAMAQRGMTEDEKEVSKTVHSGVVLGWTVELNEWAGEEKSQLKGSFRDGLG